jgi:DNA-binding MarR family transcriptional regulator
VDSSRAVERIGANNSVRILLFVIGIPESCALDAQYMHTHVLAMDTGLDLSICSGCHCLAARRRARAITRLFDEKLRPHGLRATQFSVLVMLALGGSRPIGALAEALGLEHTTLTRGAALLERNGWIGSDRSADGRERPLRLTEAGRRKLEEAFPAWQEAQEIAGRDLAAD